MSYGEDPHTSHRSSSYPPQTGEPLLDHIGPYRLVAQLASGGMASVYLGYLSLSASRRHYVAVKVMHETLASEAEYIDMFEDEAEVTSRIRHGNVCAVLDYDVCEGRRFIAMEYLHGESLRAVYHRLRRRPDPDPDATARRIARVLADVCDGLHAAHELRDDDGRSLEVVHRDVTPSNLFLTYDGVAKVTDFGVLAAARKRSHTATGVIKGKLPYVPPESLRADPPDRRMDVWAVGVVAWELLTGRRLFRRSNELATLKAVCDAPIPRPSELRPGIPRELDTIVLRALERDREDRYPTALAMGHDLARVAAGGREVVSSSDLAAWMEDLFPGRREARGQIIELAERAAHLAPPAVPVFPMLPPVAPLSDPPPSASGPTPTPYAAAAAVSLRETDRPRRRHLLTGSLAVLAAALVGGLLALGGRTVEAPALEVPAESRQGAAAAASPTMVRPQGAQAVQPPAHAAAAPRAEAPAPPIEVLGRDAQGRVLLLVRAMPREGAPGAAPTDGGGRVLARWPAHLAAPPGLIAATEEARRAMAP